LSGTVAELPLDGDASTSGVLTGSSIDTTTGDDVGQTFPTDETITGITIYTSTTQAQTLVGETITIQAQLYTSTTPDNTFTPVPGATVTATPALTGIVSPGTISNGITTGLTIPVAAQTRGMIVVSATATGVSLINSIPVHISTSLSAS